jgi:aerobic carbon-monoxide dehydrogenase large subunit
MIDGRSGPGLGRYGIGAPVRRVEDWRLLTGRGLYADDVTLPRACCAHFVRSPHAHASIASIDKSAALSAPGVVAVLTAEDVARDKLGALECEMYPKLADGGAHYRPLQPLLATGKVRYAGECVALVVAESPDQAKDAAERLAVEYRPLAAVTFADALAADAPKVWDDARDNQSFVIERGEREAVDRTFAVAAHVTKLALYYPRAAGNTLEARAAAAWPEGADGRITLRSSTQAPFALREAVCRVLGMPVLAVRVVAGDVGGSFGVKGQPYAEEVLIVWAAAKFGRAVKWTGDRSEGFVSDTQGRGLAIQAEIAVEADGRVAALRVRVTADLGAYLAHRAGVPPDNVAIGYPGPYDVPFVHAVVRGAFTNGCPVGPYRGSGKPEASFVLERLIDKAAREMGIDPVAMRRRNLIPSSAMPYRTPGGHVYDCGDFGSVLGKALELADWNGFEERRAASAQRGRRRGIGLSMHCQRAGSLSERMEIRVAPDGSVALHVGTLSSGQAHETMFAQMVHQWLGVPPARIRVFQGDTDKLLYGRGTFAQRSTLAGGSALKLAADEVILKGRRLAGWMLEADEGDIEFVRGAFRVMGTDRLVGFAEVARKSYQGVGLPAAFGIGLDGAGTHPGPNTFPNGCIVCEVDVDPDTGEVRVASLVSVDDTGVVVNPLTLEGQLHGSVAQALGEALFEGVVYERGSGQLVTGSFMDYPMPRADTVPLIVSDIVPVPTATNPLGVKGGSEAGNSGAPAAIINAIADALAPLGISDVPLPATPERIWRALRNARGGRDSDAQTGPIGSGSAAVAR